MTGRRGRRRRKLLDDLKDRRGYSHLKEGVLDRTVWRGLIIIIIIIILNCSWIVTRWQWFGTVVRQTAKRMMQSRRRPLVSEYTTVISMKTILLYYLNQDFIFNRGACVLYGTEENIFKHIRLDVLMAMTMGIMVFWCMISVAGQRTESMDG